MDPEVFMWKPAVDWLCESDTEHFADTLKLRGVELPVCAKVLQVKPDETMLHTMACDI